MSIARHGSHQSLLIQSLEDIFHGDQLLINTKKKTSLRYPASGAYMEFDVYLPRHRLSFEFQDAYHYVTTWYYHNVQSHIHEKDYTKRLAASSQGMTLITIPCWWDGNVNSLRATVHFHAPGAKPLPISQADNSLQPIPLNPIFGQLSAPSIPTVGELMLASFPTDPSFSTSVDNDTSWWMGEKYDGIRCCWHPDNEIVYSRQRKIILLQPSLQASLPSEIFLDAELWFGRGNFSYSYTLIKGATEMVMWHSLRLVSFDNPAVAYQPLAFELRYQSLLDHLSPENPFCIVAARARCNDMFAVNKAVQAVIDGEGEGVILRRCGSAYEHGRSHNLVKLKAAQGDQEGIVVGIGDDRSVEVKLPNGITFLVPPERVSVPTLTVGTVVSFSFESSARRERPVNPIIYRIRDDIEWEDVVENMASEQRFLNDSSAVPGFTSHPLYHWNLKNMRSFLESFAKNRNLDPLLPDTWFNLTSSDIREIKGGHAILKKFSGYFETVEALFPELGIDASSYKLFLWDGEDKRRYFFENYANVNDFDPLVSENWYSQPKDKIMSYRGATEVLSYYNRSVATALMTLFPDIGLQQHRFYWPAWVHSVAKTFFEDYAEENGFDPLNADNWYAQSSASIMEHKGAAPALMPYNGSIRKAIAAVFPDIMFDKGRFGSAAYATAENRRRFFEGYAHAKSLDPFNPDTWYQCSFSEILATEGSPKVISYHGNSVARALLELFPNIGLQKQKFYHKSIWSYAHNRREFFVEYAKDNQFDHRDVDAWYIQPKEKILNFKGASRILCYHNNSISKALMDLFPNYGFDKSKFVLTPLWQDINNRRKFFEDYAREMNFDPFQPEHWYSRCEDILATKGIKKLLFYHGDSVAKALLELFPNIGLEKKKFNAKYRIRELTTRRTFFEDYAKAKNFDPLVAVHWYSQSRSSIMASQGASRVLAFYNNSVSKALIDVFPDIGLDEMQFMLRELRHPVNRRKFFENLATKLGFDPYVAQNWYLQSKSSMMAEPGIDVVLSHHKNSIKRALLDLFPSIGLETSKFSLKATRWSESHIRRQFFEKYAEANGFDPKYASNWYFQSRSKLIASKEAARVMAYHQNNIFQALYDLFPELGLDPIKLRLPQAHKQGVRAMFEKYAHEKRFDHMKAENWYLQSIDRIAATKNASRLLAAYDNDIPTALAHAFPDIGLDKAKFRVSQAQYRNASVRRQFFERVALQHDFDPLNPHNWYAIDKNRVLQHQGALSVLSFHNNSIPKALIDLFPEIGLKKHLFQQPRLLWNTPEKRREFFENFARTHGFDPLISDNWYMQSAEQILSSQGGYRVMSYHSNSVEQALIDLFHGIGLDKSKFRLVTKWHDSGARRQFFEDYARTNKFDPYNPDHWYAQPVQRMKATQDVADIIVYHQNNVIKALTDLFPNIGLDSHKFISTDMWASQANQRELFLNYATEYGFDPLVAANWYSQSLENIMDTKGAKRVMSYYNNNIPKALRELFPDVGIKFSGFRSTETQWNSPSKRRAFFEQYAATQAFDPFIPTNWYQQQSEIIMCTKGAARVLFYHKNNMVTALLDLFPDIGLDPARLSSLQPHPLWQTPSSRKGFFEQYAKQNNFDPNIPDNWYAQSKQSIMVTKGATWVMCYHNQSVSRALLDLFPSIGLEQSQLKL